MEHYEIHHQEKAHRPTRLVNWLICGVALIAAFLIVGRHWVHVAPYLPYLLLAACPLMHFFMHGRHRHGGPHHQSSEVPPPTLTNADRDEPRR